MGDPWPDAPAPMYPAMIGGDMMGYGRLPRLLTYLKPDLVFMLNDVWALRDYLDRIPVEQKVVTYFPVDAVPLQKEWCAAVAARSIPVAYTKFGKSAVQKFAASANIRVIPHGIDTTTFYPIDTLQARSFLNSVTPEDFIVFNGNRNQPRKRIDLTIKGFALFADNKPKTVKIYLHMGVNDAGWNIITLCERYGIADRLLLTSLQLAPDNGVSDERLNQIYNACDVGLNTSTGEGFGLVSFEHGACKKAQVVPYSSASIELYADNGGYMIPIDHEEPNLGILTNAQVVSPEGVAATLEECYNDPNREARAEQLFNFIKQPQFDWANIGLQWDKVFEEALE
jgi:glycosyltransferase involved in cell wall biosynthesis